MAILLGTLLDLMILTSAITLSISLLTRSWRSNQSILDLSCISFFFVVLYFIVSISDGYVTLDTHMNGGDLSFVDQHRQRSLSLYLLEDYEREVEPRT